MHLAARGTPVPFDGDCKTFHEILGLCNQLIEYKRTKHAIKNDANEQPVLFAICQRIHVHRVVLEIIRLDAVRDAGTACRDGKMPTPKSTWARKAAISLRCGA